jgi:hypothetical protein
MSAEAKDDAPVERLPLIVAPLPDGEPFEGTAEGAIVDRPQAATPANAKTTRMRRAL